MLRSILLLCLALASPAVSAPAQSPSPEQLAGWLRRYPDADANRDGVLTEAEARAYRAKLRASQAIGDARPSAPADSAAPAPTLTDVPYGPHERNVLDFWRAPARTPAPVVVYIHGGGFHQGDKTRAREGALLRECLEAGVSFAAINYRFLADDVALPDILRDCARAIQFIRAHADEWNIDRSRVAAFGSSAGAGTSLWLAFHADLADPASADPVARESTRPTCVGANTTQFTYDFPRWAELFGEEMVARFGGRYNKPGFYGFKSRAELFEPAGREVRSDCDMLALMHAGAPAFFLQTTAAGAPPQNVSEFLHHPAHAKALYERARELGVRVVAVIPAYDIEPPAGAPRTLRDFLWRELGVAANAARAQ